MIVDCDIEALNMNYAGGWKADELVVMMARQTGKSMYFSMLKNREYMKHEPKSKYQFSRAKWYEVKVDFIRNSEMDQINWCVKHFGEPPKNPDAWSRWFPTWDKIRFRDAQDYEWYTLRWS